MASGRAKCVASTATQTAAHRRQRVGSAMCLGRELPVQAAALEAALPYGVGFERIFLGRSGSVGSGSAHFCRQI